MTVNREQIQQSVHDCRNAGTRPIVETEALAALLAELKQAEDRAVCSGCGSDVAESGACLGNCGGGEMIPASDLPAALRSMREAAEEARADAEQAERERDYFAGRCERVEAHLAKVPALVEVYDAAEALIERTITDMNQVARREVRLSQLLRAHKADRDALAAYEQSGADANSQIAYIQGSFTFTDMNAAHTARGHASEERTGRSAC